MKRCKLIINVANALSVLSAFLIGMSVIKLFFSVSNEPEKIQISNLFPVTFIGSFVYLVSSRVLNLIENLFTSNTINFDMSQSSTGAM